MSKIISFRLNEMNIRESQALEILKGWLDQGYSVRRVIVEALIRYDTNNQNNGKNDLDDLEEKLTKIIRLFESGGFEKKSTASAEQAELRTEFVSSIRRSIKPGIRSN